MITAVADLPKTTDWDVVWVSAASAAATAATLLFLVLQSINGARLSAIEQDRRFVLQSLQRVGEGYAEASTSALADARSRAYGTAWTNYKAGQGIQLEHFESQMGILSTALRAIRRRRMAPDDIKAPFSQQVIDEIGSKLAEIAKQDAAAYAKCRGLKAPIRQPLLWVGFCILVGVGSLVLLLTAL